MKRIKQFFAAACALTLLTPACAFASEDMRLPDSYFDDAVFVGDSISLQLRNYVYEQRESEPGFLGKAQFLTAGGLGSGNVQQPITADSLHPAYNGEKMMLEDSIAAAGAKKVYIMFGMNDIVPYGIEGALENLDLLIAKILEKSPDARIAVQSVTPILEERQQVKLNNINILAYDEALRQLCAERGYDFFDIGELMRNDSGSLIYEYCSDAPGLGMHLSDAACVPWIEYLRSHPLSGEEDGPGRQMEEVFQLTFDSSSNGNEAAQAGERTVQGAEPVQEAGELVQEDENNGQEEPLPAAQKEDFVLDMES